MDTGRRQNSRSPRRRRLGQHFLTRRTALQRVLGAIAPSAGESFLEVGPGAGALTFPLLRAGAGVLAVELDPRLASQLRERAMPFGSLSVVEGDVLEVDLRGLLGSRFPGVAAVRAVGNLPYSIASPAIRRLLSLSDLFSDWTLMTQREVAERILAAPGSRLFGVLTLLCASRAVPRRLLDLSPSCFSPPPKVHSTLLRFTPRPSPFFSDTEELSFQHLVKAAFSSRRKMIRNTLSAGLALDVDQVEAALGASGISPRDRPERIPLEGFVELTRRLGPLPLRGDASEGDFL